MNKTNVVELFEKRKVEIEKEANDSLKSLEKLISQSEAARDKRETNLRSEITRLNAEEGFQEISRFSTELGISELLAFPSSDLSELF